MKKLITFAMVAMCVNSIAQNQQNNALWQGVGTDTVKTNRFVKIKNSVAIQDNLTVDSIHVRSIKIGNNSLWVGNVAQPGTDNIQSNNGVINFGGYTPLTFSNIKAGIGTTTPNYTLQLEGDGINTNGNIFSKGSALGIGTPLTAIILSGGNLPRFIWYAKKAAFRAGQSPPGFLLDAQIGDFSAAFGQNTRAKGTHSFDEKNVFVRVNNIS